jgi:hypothetical protein
MEFKIGDLVQVIDCHLYDINFCKGVIGRITREISGYTVGIKRRTCSDCIKPGRLKLLKRASNENT